MAVQSIFNEMQYATPLLNQKLRPVQSPATKNSEDLELSSYPKLKVQKEIIESLFQKENDEEIKKSKDLDSVTLSVESLELYKRDYTHASYSLNSATVEFTYERIEYLKVETEELEIAEAEPLVFDLNGNGLELTDVRKGEGVHFDITGDGHKEDVSWVSPGDGLLSLDRNGNGIIDSGKELFGDQHGAQDGFEELAKFDNDGNGAIDKNDAVFDKLILWQDYNQNGQSESNELGSLSQYGISHISLNKDTTRAIIAGNRVEGYAHYQNQRGKGAVGEVFFNYRV